MNKVGNVFWISLVICAIFVLWGVIAPENMDLITTEVQTFLTTKFGWFYILSVAIFLIFSIYLIFSRFGSLRLGKEGDKPEFKRVTWFAMLFSAGMGIGIVFWGTAEPLAHFAAPPEADPESIEAATNALRYSVFHWGLQTWGVYTVIGLAIAYFKFRKDAPGLISSTFQPLIGDRTNGWIGKLIDIIAVFATIFGVATSLGLGATQIAGGLSFITDIKNNFGTQLVIIIIVTILFIASAWSGIGKGIKWLSNANIVLAVLLLLLTLFLGPTQIILNTFLSTMGSYVESLPSLSFQTGSFDNDFNSWVQSWTIFYWAWFIAWSPFVGTFIARVSKGRTIREFVIGVLFIPSIFCAFWFIVFGGTGLFQEIHGINTGLTDLAQEESLFGVFQGLPMSTLLSVVALFLIGTFFITSADSATFVLGMQTSGGSLNPSNKIKLVWGVIQAAIASVLLATGGLTALQTASIVSAFPFAFILLLMIWSLLKVMKEDWKTEKSKSSDKRH